MSCLPPPKTVSVANPATLIHDIQGTGATSPMENDTVTIEGVVGGDFQVNKVQMRGFFMQEESGDMDSDAATSEGIFVFDRGFGVDVNVGDVVRVDGKVLEYENEGSSLTELSNVSALTVCSTGAAVEPTDISLPLADAADWERYEGMLVTFPETLTVTENYDLSQFGVLMLSAGGRLWQPSNIVAPGADSADLAATYPTRTILLDDGNLQQDRDPVVYPPPELSASNTVRDGDTITGLTGVLDERNGGYRIQPTGDVAFSHDNPRPASPPDVGGTLRVASMNVLNYFNGDGLGGGFPTSRGATNAEEFTRQRDKIIHAVAGLDADIIGLMEIENDQGDHTAIADLTDGVNGIVGAGTYTYLDTGKIGTDEIRDALLYRPDAVELVNWAVNDDPVFNRPPVLATFRQISSGEIFSITVNHLKAKGSCPAVPTDPDADLGDGQSCWNALRVSQAQALTAWLATDPTGSSDPDFLIVGDLNSYAMEDPITTIEGDGYTNLIAQFVGDEAYSYVYFGQFGYLDHALATTSLASQVTGAAEWHINADEPHSLDYNEEYKTPHLIDSLYSPDPYRASDHDPLLVGLNLGAVSATDQPPDATLAPTMTPAAIATATLPPGTSGDTTPSDDSGGFFGLIVVIVVAIAGLLGLSVRRGR